MQPTLDPAAPLSFASRPPRLAPRRVAHGAVIASAAIGAVGLMGWLMDIELWKRGLVGLPAMVPNTALALLGATASLALRLDEEAPTRARLGAAFAAFVAVLGLLTFAEYLTGIDLRVDRLLFANAASPTGFPGRPAATTALAMASLGGALLTIDAPARRRVHPAEVLAALAMLPALPTLVGYVFSAASHDGTPHVPGSLAMSLPTSVALVVLPIGILSARPYRGVMALVTSERPGGVAARRVIVGALAIPAIGVLAVTGVHAGLYDASASAALLATAGFFGAIALVLTTAASLERSDLERRRREAELRASQEALGRSEERSRSLADWLKAALEQMPEGIILLRRDGSVEINRAALRFAHPPTTARDPYGNPVIFDVLRANGEPLPLGGLPAVRALEDGELVEGEELLIRNTDGALVPILASAAPVRDPEGRVIGAVAAFRDVSTMKQLERLREEWTSVVAHDLRQPIGVINLSAQSLAHRADRLDEPTRRAVDRIGNAVRALRRMIDDLLDATRIEAHRLQLELVDVDFAQLVHDIVDRQAHATAGHVVEIVERTPLGHARVDPVRLEQILGNLLSNAAKYGAPSGALRVELSRSADDIEVAVTNAGPGIDADELPLLFDRFRRARGAKGRPGLGLGLYIVKGLVEAHGGRISAESVPGETTTFRFALPNAGAPHVVPPAPHQAHA